MWALAWPLIRPILPYLLAAGGLWAGWWYVGSLRAEITQQRAELEVERDKLSKAFAHIRQRIDAERQQREVNDEAARLARVARNRVPDTTRRLREYRSADLPAVAAGHASSAGDCPAPQPVAAVAESRVESRSAEVDQACASTDADLSVLAAEIRRLDRVLSNTSP